MNFSEIFRALGNPETALLQINALAKLVKVDRLSLLMVIRRFNKDKESEMISLPEFV